MIIQKTLGKKPKKLNLHKSQLITEKIDLGRSVLKFILVKLIKFRYFLKNLQSSRINNLQRQENLTGTTFLKISMQSKARVKWPLYKDQEKKV